MTFDIRESIGSDIKAIENIHISAFGKQKGPEIRDLVLGLLEDKTGMPRLSLAAFQDGQMVGHILFTKAIVREAPENISAQILAPLAVLPDAQNMKVGGRLIEEGLKRLKQSGVHLVFVLGHPGYYPRYGFNPAGVRGFSAPYPIPEEHADAWMVQPLTDGIIGTVHGQVKCCEVLNQPEHWRE